MKAKYLGILLVFGYLCVLGQALQGKTCTSHSQCDPNSKDARYCCEDKVSGKFTCSNCYGKCLKTIHCHDWDTCCFDEEHRHGECWPNPHNIHVCPDPRNSTTTTQAPRTTTSSGGSGVKCQKTIDCKIKGHPDEVCVLSSSSLWGKCQKKTGISTTTAKPGTSCNKNEDCLKLGSFYCPNNGTGRNSICKKIPGSVALCQTDKDCEIAGHPGEHCYFLNPNSLTGVCTDDPNLKSPSKTPPGTQCNKNEDCLKLSNFYCPNNGTSQNSICKKIPGSVAMCQTDKDCEIAGHPGEHCYFLDQNSLTGVCTTKDGPVSPSKTPTETSCNKNEDCLKLENFYCPNNGTGQNSVCKKIPGSVAMCQTDEDCKIAGHPGEHCYFLASSSLTGVCTIKDGPVSPPKKPTGNSCHSNEDCLKLSPKSYCPTNGPVCVKIPGSTAMCQINGDCNIAGHPGEHCYFPISSSLTGICTNDPNLISPPPKSPSISCKSNSDCEKLSNSYCPNGGTGQNFACAQISGSNLMCQTKQDCAVVGHPEEHCFFKDPNGLGGVCTNNPALVSPPKTKKRCHVNSHCGAGQKCHKEKGRDEWGYCVDN